MAKVVRARALLPSLSPTVDQASVAFTFESLTATDYSNIAGVTTAMIAFFNTTGGSHPVSYYLSSVLSRATNACSVEVYDITGHLDGSPAGSPVAIVPFTLGGSTTGATLPEGVAATVSFRSDYGTDVEFGTGTRPRARDRNRVYIGPLMAESTTNESVTNRCIFQSPFISNMLGALFNLSGTHTSGGDSWNLRVWTRAGAAVKLPTIGFMDDRPDYQRRRSDPNPGGRVSRSLSSV